MEKNVKYEPGWRKAYACTKPDKPVSGDPVRVGNMTGIALTDEDAAGKTVVDKGPFSAKFTVRDNGGAGIGAGTSACASSGGRTGCGSSRCSPMTTPACRRH